MNHSFIPINHDMRIDVNEVMISGLRKVLGAISFNVQKNLFRNCLLNAITATICCVINRPKVLVGLCSITISLSIPFSLAISFLADSKDK